jgi:hypothetical protein
MWRKLAPTFSLTEPIQPKPITAGDKAIHSARSRNRAAAFNEDLATWYRYALRTAKTEAEQAEVHAEYQRRRELGPDWANHHTCSDYREPHVNCVSHDDRRATLAAFDDFRAWQYRNERAPHGQAVSKNYREVLSVLLSYAVRYGQCYPSQARIAQLCCITERTVRRALQWLRTMGFLDWRRRLREKPHPSGSRQTSNAYRLVTRVGLALIGSVLFRKRSSGHNFRPSSSDGRQTHETDLATPLFWGT